MMNDLIIYLLKVSLISAILYSFYRAFLIRNSFHFLNRFFLLSIILFSVLCPILEITSPFESTITDYSKWDEEILQFSSIDADSGNGSATSAAPVIFKYLMFLYWSGILVFFGRFARQLYLLIQTKTLSSKRYEGKYTFIFTDNYNAPFSFFNWIYLPVNYGKLSGNQTIIEHEKVHSKQLHSLDLIVSEIFCIAFWFNPFVYFLKHSLKSTHEYLADNAVVTDKCTATDYLKILVSSSEMSCLSGIANQFNSLTIKKRIEMITKNKTSKIKSLTYLLLIPLGFILIQAFSVVRNENNPPKIRPLESNEITLVFGFQGLNPVTKKEFTHGGIDFKAALGTPVVAPASGIVIKVSNEEAWGNLIVIKHDEHFETWFAHLDGFSVETGSQVSLGQEIGKVGNTGYSTGSHLHYEVRKDGVRVNPADYFQ